MKGPSNLLEQFFFDGFAIVPQAVSIEACNNALRSVNKNMEKAEKKSFSSESALISLFNDSPGWSFQQVL